MMKTMLTGFSASARTVALAGLAVAFIGLAPQGVRAEDPLLNPDDPVVWSKISADESASAPAPAAETKPVAPVEPAAPAAAEAPAAKAGQPVAETPAAEPEAVEQKPASSYYGKKAHLTARLRLEYEYREAGDATDSDMYARFYGDGRDMAAGRFDVYVSARLHTDLDKPESESQADDPYYSVDDSNGVTEDRLLQLYGDIHSKDRKLALRAGRQYIDISDYIQMDGGQVMYNENGALGGRVYVGHPVSYYSSVSGDYAAGLSLVGRPWEGNKARLTVARYHDDSVSDDNNDQNYFIDVQQRVSEASRLRGQLSVLNDEYRLGRADWFYSPASGETDFSVGASYWGSYDANTRVYSPLYDALGEMDPYAYTYARLTQQIVPGWLLSPGVSLRFADNTENSYNNRDYANYDLTFIYAPSRAFSASIAAEYWAVEDSDSFLGLSGDVRYRHGRVWEVSGGAAFAQYTYDTYSDLSYEANGGQTVITENGTVIEESPYVRTYFVRGKWRITRMFAVRAQFDIEDDDAAEDLAYRGRGSVEVKY